MNRFYCTLVFGLPVLVGLAICQNTARGDDATDALLTAATSSGAAVAKPAESSCAACECAGCDQCYDLHWTVGVDALWLSPVGNQRTAEYQLRNPNQTIIEGFSASAANSADMAVSPRVTLGLQGECWGIEARYWRMDDPVSNFGTSLLDGTGAIAEVGFRAEMFDLEITRRFCLGDTQMQLAGGVCYGQLDQSSYLSANDFYGGGLYSGSVLSYRNFSGAGLTTALSGVRPIGCCESNLKLFYSARASILWDNHTTAAVDTWASYGTTGAYAPGYEAALADDSASLFVGELEIGLQWDIPLKCIPANAFVRGAFEYQYWGTSGCTEASATAFAGVLRGVNGYAVGSSGSESHVNLLGFSLGTGVTW